MKETPEAVRELAMWICGQEYSMKREQPLQRPWGQSMLGVHEEQQGSRYVCSGVSQSERYRRVDGPGGHCKDLAFTWSDLSRLWRVRGGD